MGFNTQAVAMSAAAHAEKLARYTDSINNLPAPGCGHGAHRALLGAANYAVAGGVDEERFICDVLRKIPAGHRTVTRAEITGAFHRALADGGRPYGKYQAVTPLYKPDLLSKIIEGKNTSTLNDIRLRSPLPIPTLLQDQQSLFLATLFKETDWLYVGDRFGTKVATCKDLLYAISCGSSVGPLFCINPLSGCAEKSTSGNLSMRADACVADFRYCLVEFDQLSLEEQAGFLLSVDMPMSAIIFSGNRSLHALIPVDIPDAERWKSEVESKLYLQRLAPLGVDTACRNPSRLARMPGWVRSETMTEQSLLYLSATGKVVGK